MTGDLITLIANLALTLSLIIALIFGIVQVKADVRERRECLTFDKTTGSFVTTSREKYTVMFEDIREKTPDPFWTSIFNGPLNVLIGERKRIHANHTTWSELKI